MDNLTHSLVGLMLARAGLDRGEKGSALMIMLAANAPDIDAVTFPDTLTYLEVHRGYAHSLVCLPLVALLPLLLVKLATRTRITWSAYLACAIAVLSHLLLDWTNVYGIRLFMPVSHTWFHLDITDIVDPVIWAVLLAAWAAPALVSLVTSEIGSRKTKGPKLGWAWFALLAVLAYDTGRWEAHERAISLIDAHNYRGEPALAIHAFPVRFGLFQWRGVVEGDGFIYEVPVDLRRNFRAGDGKFEYPAVSSPLMDAARTTRTFQVFEKFDQLPFWELSPEVDVTKVELLDLRFGSVEHPGFEAVAMVEPDGRIADVQFTFGGAIPGRK
jgi:inner membrane protein